MDTKEAKIYVALLIAAAVLAVMLVWFLITTIRHQKKNRELYKAKIRAEILTLENERKRIAADLHDELGPLVVSMKLKLNRIELAQKEGIDTMAGVFDNIGEVIKRMKEISNNLLPALLIKRGLVVAMNMSVAEINSSGTLRLSFLHKDIPELPEQTIVNLYRVLQEIIHNTIKHAAASDLSIELFVEKQKLIILTADNGKGFDFHLASSQYAGLGLRNMLSRTELLQGRMFIETSAGKGTKYKFELPL